MTGRPALEEPPRRWWLILTVAVAMAAVVPLQSPRASASSKRVRLEDVRFRPERIEVQAGDTVVWEAEDDRHTVTARNGEFDSSDSGLLVEGDEFRWRFTNAGRYPYFCRVQEDEGMQGEVVVLGNPAYGGATSSSTTTSTRPAAQVVAATAPPSTTTTTQPSTTTTTQPSTTTTTRPSTTTTSRPLVTSSTVNLATTTTGQVAEPVTPHEPPTVDPDAESGVPPEASLPGSPAALRRHSDTGPSSTTEVGLIVGLPVAAAGLFVVSRRWRRRRASA
jgi:plastocyanin